MITSQRLQKILAAAGVASRRAAEELIVAGRVRVNGKVVRELGTKADSRRDKITVDGKTLVRERHVYYLLHKPRETMTTLNDPEGRPTVMELLTGVPERVFPVGRLDWNTSGALLLTNDGDLAQALIHPRKKVLKVYAVKLKGHPTEQTLEKWRSGVELDDGKTAPADVWILSQGPGATWLRVGIREGRNRQIHRMGDVTGHPVLRLTRQEFAGLDVEDLRPGEYRELTGKEVDDLRAEHILGTAPPTTARRGRGRPATAGERPRPGKGRQGPRPEWHDDERGADPVGVEKPRAPRPTAAGAARRARPAPRADRPVRGPRDDRPPRREVRDDRPPRRGARDDRPARGARDDRPPSRGARDDRPVRGARDDRAARGPRDDRPPRRDVRDDRPARGPRDDRPPRRDARDERPARGPREDRPARPPWRDDRPARGAREDGPARREDRPARPPARDDRPVRRGDGRPTRRDDDRRGPPPPRRAPPSGGPRGRAKPRPRRDRG